MKYLLVLLFSIALTNSVGAQSTDSLKKELTIEKNDTVKLRLMASLFYKYLYSNPDSAAKYLNDEMALVKKAKMGREYYFVLIQYSELAYINGNFPEALKLSLQVLETLEQAGTFTEIAATCSILNDIYRSQGDYENAIRYGRYAKSLFDAHFKFTDYSSKKEDSTLRYVYILHGLALTEEKFDHLDSALVYTGLIDKIYTQVLGGKVNWAPFEYVLGNILFKKGNFSKAIQNYHSGISFAVDLNIPKDIMDNSNGLAKVYFKTGKPDSSIFYATRILELSETTNYPIVKLDALALLARIYKSKNNIDSAVKYFELTISTKDSLFNQEKIMQFQNMTFNEQLRQQQILEERKQYQNRVKTYALIGGLIVLLLITFLLYRNNRQKQKAKLKIERSYNELKSMQSQLIQREKMASLGELSAGIAHEIQNPLNFVNNFSEVSSELISEMMNEADKGNIQEVKSIANDVQQNLNKIVHHGKRADAIVKGMLQHSRTSGGQKEPTDINALADEYLRLAYHACLAGRQGFRAKDKSINAVPIAIGIKTSFDPAVGKINVAPQDIGRVLVNLFNNAFYAVSANASDFGKTLPDELVTTDNRYEPTVIISTKKLNDRVEISVWDNGNGIPQKILDKIFQPFFTTKPTGQGTGLGLSLAYDIVKAHGGEIIVDTKEGEGTTFTIQLPVK